MPYVAVILGTPEVHTCQGTCHHLGLCPDASVHPHLGSISYLLPTLPQILSLDHPKLTVATKSPNAQPLLSVFPLPSCPHRNLALTQRHCSLATLLGSSCFVFFPHSTYLEVRQVYFLFLPITYSSLQNQSFFEAHANKWYHSLLQSALLVAIISQHRPASSKA